MQSRAIQLLKNQFDGLSPPLEEDVNKLERRVKSEEKMPVQLSETLPAP